MYCPRPNCDQLTRLKLAPTSVRGGGSGGGGGGGAKSSSMQLLRPKVDVLCQCGFNFCTRCQQRGHWPSSCYVEETFNKSSGRLAGNLANAKVSDWACTIDLVGVFQTLQAVCISECVVATHVQELEAVPKVQYTVGQRWWVQSYDMPSLQAPILFPVQRAVGNPWRRLFFL